MHENPLKNIMKRVWLKAQSWITYLNSTHLPQNVFIWERIHKKYLYKELFEGWGCLAVGEVCQCKTVLLKGDGIQIILTSSVSDHGWEYRLRLIQCLRVLFCFSCCMKYSDQSNLRENRFILAQSSKIKSITATKSQQQPLRKLVSLHEQSRNKDEC